jgi:hypothetical protein
MTECPFCLVTRHDRGGQYLEGLSSLCREVSRKPVLLPDFAGIVALVASTLEELQRRRLAA